jgi:hypothetical protein
MKAKKSTISTKRIFPHIRKMTWEEQREAGLQNPGLIMEYCRLKIPLSAGYSDTVEIYRNGNSLMILTTNRHLEYVGLEEVDILDGNTIGGVFFLGYQITDTLGCRWRQMKADTLIKRLSEYL